MSHEDDIALLNEIADRVTGMAKEGGRSAGTDLINRYVDEDAVLQFAAERAADFMTSIFLRHLTGGGVAPEAGPLFGTMFLDGFIFGALFQSERLAQREN